MKRKKPQKKLSRLAVEKPLQKRLLIGLPSYGPQDPAVGDALSDLQTILNFKQIPHARLRVPQCPYFSHAMNVIIAKFLAQPEQPGFADRLLFLDNDIVFDPLGALKLVESDSECIGGDYALKTTQGGSTAIRNGLVNGALLGVKRMGTGFVCFARPLLERMAARSERYVWDGLSVPQLFADVVVDGELEPGDVTFYRKLRDAGGSAWIDPSIYVGHVGSVTFEINRAAPPSPVPAPANADPVRPAPG